MLIKEVKKEKKHLCRIIFEDADEIFLDSNVCAKEGLTKGVRLSPERLEEIKFSSDYEQAHSRALWYLDRMDYTEKALYEKLVKAGFSKKASAKVLAKFCELKIVDDHRFAERLALRYSESNVSKKEAVSKLLRKGVPLELAKQVTEEHSADENEQITALLEGKYARKLASENGEQKVFAALVRKGFSYSAVRTAMKKYIAELEFCED